jgi:PDZ domain-containing protein
MKENINIIYEKIKKYIKENYKSLIFLVAFACFCFYDTGYSIYKPGGTINASSRVSGDNLNQSSGSFNMAYVGYMEGKLPFYLLAKVLPSWELVKNEDLTVSNSEDINDVLVRDQLYYKEAISNAIYVAFNQANVDYTVNSSEFYVMYKTEDNDSNLKVGDKVIAYDDIEIDNTEEFINYINTKSEGDVIKITYTEDNQELTTNSTIYSVEDKLYVGLSLVNILELSSNYNIEVKSKSSESGPSGGLITSLAIYNTLVSEDITKGYKIVGTGTISLDGTVGEIGSVESKLSSAVKDKADIFLCPVENYEDAKNYANEKNYDIIIKEVATFKEAIEYLSTLEEK